MDKFKPMLFTCLKDYKKEQLIKDIISGIIVAIIALPLSIALALASGVGPEQGLYTAVVAGFLISFFGGSKVQIAGPTAAFATIVAGIVAESGMGGLALATIMAGILLILMGIFKFGQFIKFIPFTITTGFTAGIALTILIGQIKDFLGLTYPAGTVTIETGEKVFAIVKNFSTINLYAVLVGAVCLAILIVWPKISKTIPGSIIAVIVGILIVKFLKLPVNTIGDLYSVKAGLPSFTMPEFSFKSIKAMLPNACTIAILAAIESLLSCVVADGMIEDKHRSNTELIAQGIGNIGSAFFGGIPATGAIARTAANIKSGGRTPISGIVHAIVLVLILVVLMPYAAWIPMPTIAAILFMVSYNMCQWRTFVALCKTAPKADIFVLVLTFVLTVAFDLVVAIEFGMLCAGVLLIKKISDNSSIKSWKYKEQLSTDDNNIIDVPHQVRVYEINGPMFFGASDVIEDIKFKEYTKCLVIRMRSVSVLDITAMNHINKLLDSCEKAGIQLILSHVNEQPLNVMKKSGFYDRLGAEYFCKDIESALEKASSI